MNRSAFTLIEFLIVVGIIGILAAIAVPNFLNARIRTLVSRVQIDMRAMGTAIEAYHADHGVYPRQPPKNTCIVVTRKPLTELTTPVAYLSVIPIDVFHIEPDEETKIPYPLKYGTCTSAYKYWYLFSWGPDIQTQMAAILYAPSNGVISIGDLKYTTAHDIATIEPQ